MKNENFKLHCELISKKKKRSKERNDKDLYLREKFDTFQIHTYDLSKS